MATFEKAFEATGIGCTWSPMPPSVSAASAAGGVVSKVTCTLFSGATIDGTLFHNPAQANQATAQTMANTYCALRGTPGYGAAAEAPYLVAGSWMITNMPTALVQDSLMTQLGAQGYNLEGLPPVLTAKQPRGCNDPFARGGPMAALPDAARSSSGPLHPAPTAGSLSSSDQSTQSAASTSVTARIQSIVCNQDPLGDEETLSDDLTEGGSRDFLHLHADIALGCTAGGSADLSSEGILLVWRRSAAISGAVVRDLGDCLPGQPKTYWVSDLTTDHRDLSWAVVNMSSLRVAMKLARSADAAVVGPTSCVAP